AGRNAAREREFSVRTALGGSRARLFRQLLTESLLLVAAGTAAGWWLAVAATRALAAWSDLDMTLAPDGNVLAFTLLLSFGAALVLGLAPLRSAGRTSIGLVLKTTSLSSTGATGKLRTGQLVVAAQIALCLTLLVGAGL